MVNKEYLVRLIAEVSNYFLGSKPQRMVISLHHEEDGMHLSILDDRSRTDAELSDMTKSLNTAARPELADYYGAMGGSDILGSARLDLIGWQIKHADVARTAEGTKIDLWLGSDRFDPSRFNMPAK
jgi:hypothetical protein